MPRRKAPRILGIDPGLTRMGFGIVQSAEERTMPVAYGCINAEHIHNTADRLLFIEQELEKILLRYHPSVVAVEKLFFSKNISTAMAVSQARGVILLCLARHHVTPSEYTPQQIKSAVSGYGKASKLQVQRMVQMLLHLPRIPEPDDAADALAVALTASALMR